MKVLSVAGYHHTGKTTTVVELIKELKLRGYKVVSIKDIHSEKFRMEKEGSNSWRHWQASNDTVIARGLNETFQIWHRRLSLNEMLSHLEADYVIIEGMKSASVPHIICADSESQLAELIDRTVFAIAGNFPANQTLDYNLPVFNPIKDIKKLTDLIEKKVFEILPLPKDECCGVCGLTCHEMVAEILAGNKTRNDCRTDRKLGTHLKIDGKEVKIVPFVQNIFCDTILGFVRNLKGCEKGKIEIVIDE